MKLFDLQLLESIVCILTVYPPPLSYLKVRHKLPRIVCKTPYQAYPIWHRLGFRVQGEIRTESGKLQHTAISTGLETR